MVVRESPVALATAEAPPAEGVGFGGGPASRDALVHEGGESLILRSQYGYSFFGDHVPHFVQ